MLMRVSYEGFDLSEAQVTSELMSILGTSPQIATYRQIPITRELGLAETVVETVPHMLFALNALWDVGGKEALKSFLTGVAGGLAAKLFEYTSGRKQPEAGGDKNRPSKPSRRKSISNLREEQQGRITIEVGRIKIEVGVKDGTVEIKTIGAGEAGQVA